MTLDFTFSKYKELCQAIIDSGYPVLNIEKCLSLKNKPDTYILLRHDVDLLPERSLIISQIEAEFNISSTYYFRTTEDVFKPKLIQQIAELGHEIGYHYEVLDKAKGDIERAIKIFSKELMDFRDIIDIRTICMHGNSRTRWDNRDVWKNHEFKQYGIIGEAYISINFNDLKYFSDTGRSWNPKYKIKDVDYDGFKQKKHDVKNTDDLINIIRNKKYQRLYILVHPDDWCDDLDKWAYNIATRKLKNIGKLCIRYLNMRKK